MGTIQLPQYEPQQIESGRAQRQLDVSGQVALGRAQQNLINTAFEGLDVIAGIAGKIRSQKINDEINRARIAYKQGTTTKMTDLEANPLSTPQEEYPGIGQGLLDETSPLAQDLPNHKAFVDYRRGLMEEITGNMKYKEARKRFQTWADETFIAEQDAVLTWDIGKTKELLYDNWSEEFIQAVELGNPRLVLDHAKSGLEAGIISQKQYDDNLDEAFSKMAARGALLKAGKMGYEAGLQWLSDPSNLKWQTHKGEDRRMSLQQQEDLVRIFQAEWDRARRADLEQRRATTFSTDNEYLQKLVGNDPSFTVQYIINDARSAAYDGQPYNLREKYIGILNKRAEDALKGTKPPGEDDGILTKAVYEKYMDPSITSEEFAEWLRSNTKYDKNGNLLIHEKLAQRFTDKADGKPQIPAIVSGRKRLEQSFDEQAALAKKKGDTVKADQYRKEYVRSLSDFVQWLDNPEVAKSLLRDPALIDQWVDTRVKKMVDDNIGEWLSKVTIRPNEISGGSVLAPLTEGERPQRAIQQGELVGREPEFAGQLGQYYEGARQKAATDLGRAPDYIKPFPGGQPHFYYQAPEGVDPKYLYGGNTLIFTYLEEKNDLKLKVWDGRMERWEDPPAQLTTIWKAPPPDTRPLAQQGQSEADRQKQARDRAEAERALRGMPKP